MRVFPSLYQNWFFLFVLNVMSELRKCNMKIVLQDTTRHSTFSFPAQKILSWRLMTDDKVTSMITTWWRLVTQMKTEKTRDDVVTTGVTKSVDLVKTRDDTHLTQASSRRTTLQTAFHLLRPLWPSTFDPASLGLWPLYRPRFKAIVCSGGINSSLTLLQPGSNLFMTWLPQVSW
jgi:hypothetical protein